MAVLVHEGERNAINQTVCAECGTPVVLRSRRWRYGPDTMRPLDGMTHTWECPEHGLEAGLTTVPYGPLMPRWPADHVKRPEPDHTRADLRTGLVWLAEEAEKYVPAKVLMDRYRDMEADLARIPVGTLSKHKTARWTGRHWKEIEG